jgi:hypothetical protein
VTARLVVDGTPGVVAGVALVVILAIDVGFVLGAWWQSAHSPGREVTPGGAAGPADCICANDAPWWPGPHHDLECPCWSPVDDQRIERTA